MKTEIVVYNCPNCKKEATRKTMKAQPFVCGFCGWRGWTTHLLVTYEPVEDIEIIPKKEETDEEDDGE